MYSLDHLQSHIDDFLEKAEIRSEAVIADAGVMARSIQTNYKISSDEYKLLGTFQKSLESVRRKRFPKVVKPTLRDLPDEPKPEED